MEMCEYISHSILDLQFYTDTCGSSSAVWQSVLTFITYKQLVHIFVFRYFFIIIILLVEDNPLVESYW